MCVCLCVFVCVRVCACVFAAAVLMKPITLQHFNTCNEQETWRLFRAPVQCKSDPCRPPAQRRALPMAKGMARCVAPAQHPTAPSHHDARSDGKGAVEVKGLAGAELGNLRQAAGCRAVRAAAQEHAEHAACTKAVTPAKADGASAAAPGVRRMLQPPHGALHDAGGAV